MSEFYRNSCIMLGIAFCGIGFIHLNIAEIYEEIIGARKCVLRLAIRAQNERVCVLAGSGAEIFLKELLRSRPTGERRCVMNANVA